MDLLTPGDVVILATPPAFRWVHYTYAIEKGLNVFMEKPVTVDGPTSVRMLELNKKAIDKNLKVAVGLMCRHCKARQELFDRIQNGEIGDLTMLRAYRMAGPTGSAAAPAERRQPERTALSDQELPRLPVAQRRCGQRFLDSQHRRVVLDEKRVAGESDRTRRTSLSRRLRRPEL